MRSASARSTSTSATERGERPTHDAAALSVVGSAACRSAPSPAMPSRTTAARPRRQRRQREHGERRPRARPPATPSTTGNPSRGAASGTDRAECDRADCRDRTPRRTGRRRAALYVVVARARAVLERKSRPDACASCGRHVGAGRSSVAVTMHRPTGRRLRGRPADRTRERRPSSRTVGSLGTVSRTFASRHHQSATRANIGTADPHGAARGIFGARIRPRQIDDEREPFVGGGLVLADRRDRRAGRWSASGRDGPRHRRRRDGPARTASEPAPRTL